MLGELFVVRKVGTSKEGAEGAGGAEGGSQGSVRG